MIENIALFEGVHPVILTLWISVACAVIFGGILAFMLFFLVTNREAWFFFKERFAKGGAVLESLDSSGIYSYEHVKAGGEETILENTENPGKKRFVVFLPRFIRWIKGTGINATEQKDYNSILKQRGILRGIKKPLYHGSIVATISAPGGLIEGLESNTMPLEMKNTIKEYLSALKDKAKDSIKVTIDLVNYWDVTRLLECVNHSYSLDDIKNLEDRNYQRGVNDGRKGRPEKGSTNYGWIIGLIISFIIIGAAVWLWQSGALKGVMGGLGK